MNATSNGIIPLVICLILLVIYAINLILLAHWSNKENLSWQAYLEESRRREISNEEPYMGGYYISPFLSLAKILRWLIPLALIIIVANNKSELSAAVNTLMG